MDSFKERLNLYIKEKYEGEDATFTLNTCNAPEFGNTNASKKKSRLSRKYGLKNESIALEEAVSFSPDMELAPTFQERLFKIIDEKNLKDPDVYKASMIDKRLFSKIRSDKNYTPSKNTIIQFCFGLRLDVDDALDLLSSAGYTLSFSVLSDVIVRYYLIHKNYDLMDLNISLYEHDLKPLFE